MEEYREILLSQESKHARTLLLEHDITCRQIDFGDDPVLYLARSHWTNRFDEKRESTIGLFFAIWVSPVLLKENRFAYNIHSKQLRKLVGYKLTSRKFAEEFRRAVEANVRSWPGVSLSYGPGTLLEGRDICNIDDFANKVERRIEGFVGIYKVIDDLLEASAN